MVKSFHKVVYKPDSQSTDEYIVIVNGDVYQKWIKGDKTIPLVEVVDAFQVFHSGQGAQGLLGRVSKQQLDAVFGTTKEDDAVVTVLERGQLQAASEFSPPSTPRCRVLERARDGFAHTHTCTHKHTRALLFVGVTAAKESFSSTNDSKHGAHVVSAGAYAGGGHGGR
ncbi:hypothetical protein ACQY0O_003325 [Thecaphora frezii]